MNLEKSIPKPRPTWTKDEPETTLRYNAITTWTVIILCLCTIAFCITYVIKNNFFYSKEMTGVIIEKYKLPNTSKYGTSEDLKLVVQYPTLIVTKLVNADTFYRVKVGDSVTFDEKIGDNNISQWCLGLAMLLFVFIIVFTVFRFSE